MRNKRALVLLFSAHIISNFASGITMLAIPWYLVSKLQAEQTNAIMMAVITFLTLFWGIYAGTLIDKYNRKRIFQAQQIVAGSIMIGASIYGLLSGEMPILLIALCACATLFSWSLYYPNLYAFVQELFEARYYKQINSGIELIGQITNFLGMLIGSVLLAGTAEISWWPETMAIEAWSLERIILMDGITYLTSAVIISFVAYTPGEYFRSASGGVLTRLIEGFAYLRKRPELMVFGICSHIIFACLLVFVHVSMAMYVHNHLGLDFEAGGISMASFEAVYSLGAIATGLMSILLVRAMARNNLIKQIIFLVLLMSAIYFCMAFTRVEWIFWALAFLTGLANSGTRILRVTYIVRIVPNTIIGRTNSFFKVVNTVIRLLLITMFSFAFFQGANIHYGLMVMGAVCGICGLLLILFFPKFEKEAAYG